MIQIFASGNFDFVLFECACVGVCVYAYGSELSMSGYGYSCRLLLFAVFLFYSKLKSKRIDSIWFFFLSLFILYQITLICLFSFDFDEPASILSAFSVHFDHSCVDRLRFMCMCVCVGVCVYLT